MIARPRQPDVVQSTERLVAAPSPNPPGDERAAAGVVTDICAELGLSALRLAGIPTLSGLGPGLLERAHTADERVSLRGLRQAVDVYRTLARDFCEGEHQ
jgi:acetylornithine deacetylase/succinyl-diaminopimelate desuccinylase-like protein